jgi:Holliday junction resolvasome RuvABC endonuclease subunit
MILLALDLATRTGWALQEGLRYESGYESFAIGRGESPGMRYVAFNRWLNLIVPPTLELVVYEQPFAMRSGQAAEIALGFATRVQELCAQRHIEHSAVNGSRLKKWATGHGNAKKTDMMEAVARRWRRVDDDNEADAVALLHYALAEIVGPVRVPSKA